MPSICAAVLPWPKTTSGNPQRTAAMQVDLGEFPGVLKGLDADLMRGLLGRQPAVAHGFEQLLEIVRIQRAAPEPLSVARPTRALRRDNRTAPSRSARPKSDSSEIPL